MFKIFSLMAAAVSAAACAGAAAWAQTPIPPAARDFAAMAAQSDAYEIEAARIAEIEAVNPRVRAFAQKMIEDHTRASQALRQAAAASGLEPPPGMSGDEAHLLYALQSLRGPDFDRTYLRQQVLAHDQALAVVQSYADTGSDVNLRRAAESTLPMIQHHLEMAQQLLAALSGS